MKQPSQWRTLPATARIARWIAALRKGSMMVEAFPVAAGGTALITGASSGIGAAFARQLAMCGYDLILVARREARLRALADELQQQYGRASTVLVADLTESVQLAHVEEAIRACATLSLLVNNAGFGTRGAFAAVDLAKHLAMIDLHVTVTTRLTHAALAGLLARKHGAIINVASLSAFLPSVENVTYCATKSYLTMLTEALHTELRGTGVFVQALCPGYTHTEIHDTPEFAGWDRSQAPAESWMSADDVVTASLAALHNDRIICVPGQRNRLIVARTYHPRRALRFWNIPRWLRR